MKTDPPDTRVCDKCERERPWDELEPRCIPGNDEPDHYVCEGGCPPAEVRTVNPRADLQTRRPWVMRETPRGWEVLAPSSFGPNPVLVSAYLSERDARLLVRASECEDLLLSDGGSNATR